MKLHLPKALRAALFAIFAIGGMQLQAAESFDTITRGDNFWASEYSFSFVLNDVTSNGNVVAAYWGTAGTSNLGANGFTIAYDETSGTYTLTVASGKLNNTDIASNTTFEKGSNGTNSAVLTGLQAGVLYTVTGVSTNGNSTVMTLDSAYITPVNSTAYNGKMNGDKSSPDSGVNSAYAVSGGNSAIVWAGTSDGAAAVDAANWQTITNVIPESIGSSSVLVFEAVDSLSKNVDITGLGSVGSISVYDNYTFTSTASGTLTNTKIASGNTLTLSSTAVEGNTITGGVTGGTLAITSGKWSATNGAITSSVTVSDGSSLELGNGASYTSTDFGAVNNGGKFTTSGTGYITLKLNSNELTLSEDVTVNNNYVVGTDFSLNGKGYDYNGPDGRTFSIGSGNSFTVNGAFSIVSRAIVDIAGGTVEATSIKLGHDTQSGTDARPYWGKIAMSDNGSLKTGTITFQTDKVNVIDITGGVLEFTAAQAIARGNNTASTVSIVGESAEKTVSLIANTDWTLDGDGLATAPVVGNVTVDAANSAGITLDNVNLIGAIINNADLTLGAGVKISENTEATLSGTGTTTFVATITNSGKFALNSSVETSKLLTAFEIKVQGASGYVLDANNLDNVNDGQNGFVFSSGSEYWLVQGGENTLADGVSISTAGGDTFELRNSTTEGNTGIYIVSGENYVDTSKYYITTGDVTVVGTGAENATGADSYVLQGGTMQLTGGTVKTSEIAYTSGHVNLASGAQLTLDQVDNSTTATQWLINTTGTKGSVIEITADANFGEVADTPTPYTTNFEGKWVVSNGATLKLGGLDNGWNNDYAVDLLKLEALEAKDGTIRYFGGNSSVSKLIVSDVSTLHIYEMYDDNSFLSFNEVQLDSDLTIKSTWRGNVNIKSLTGDGTLIVSTDGNSKVININAASGFSGELDLHNNANTKVNITTDKGAAVRVKADENSTIESLTLADGAKLAYDAQYKANTYTINNVKVSGSATLGIEAAATFHEGCINIENLTNAEGAASAELTLGSNYKNGPRNITNLNGGDFNGKIIYDANSTGSRKHGFNINHETVAQDAEISIKESQGTSSIALGIGVDKVTVKALSGGTNDTAVYSGKQTFDNSNAFAAVDTTVRTLEIATDDQEYTANIAIKENINLVKSGIGTQNLGGAMDDFNGTIEVSGGTLAQTKADTSVEISTLTVKNGATYSAAGTTNIGALVLSTGLSDEKAAVSSTGALTLGTVTIDLTGYGEGEYLLATTTGALSYDIGEVNWNNLADGLKAELNFIQAATFAAENATNGTLVLTLSQAEQQEALTKLTVTGVDTDNSTGTVLTLTTAENAANAVFDTKLNAEMTDANWENIKAALAGAGITLEDEIAITFVGADGQTFDFDGADGTLTAPTITINGEGTQGTQVLTGNGTVVGNYVTAYIPEPTTGTLSILALAALAVRRRRR